MPLPTVGDVHINVPLTNISVAFAASFMSVAEQVFPSISVRKQSDRYYVYDLGDWNRISVGIRAPATESEGSGWSLSNDTYYCDQYALHKDTAFEEYANADSALSIDTDTVEFLTRQMKMKEDKEWANTYFSTGVWTGSSTGSDVVPPTKWDASNGTPIDDIRTQIRSIHTKTGYKPNKLVLGAQVWDKLQDSAQFLERIKYSQTGIVSKSLLAQALDIEEVIVGEVMEVTSNPGATTATSQMFGERALLLHVAKRPGRRVPSAGYKFQWDVGGIPNSRIRKFTMDKLNAERLEIQSNFDFKLVSADLGAMFDNVLT